jgi:hypothetical protein
MKMARAISRTDIAEIHEAIARRRPAQTEVEQKDQDWHGYAAKIIRENDKPGPIGERQFTHRWHWK